MGSETWPDIIISIQEANSGLSVWAAYSFI